LRSPAAVTSTSYTLLFPLTFLSSAFVDPDTLPAGLEAIVNANPVSALVDASRGLMAGNAAGSDIAVVLATTAVLTAIFLPLTTHLYRTRA
jgi:ABC-2 type transport system permease protein